MGMQINTNVSALNTFRNLTATQNSMSKSLEKLSSGLRINRASDDAAGLVISEGLKSQIGGLQVASRNAQDGISVVQTAEGALGTAQNILQRLRDLGVQAGNDSNSKEARDAIKAESDSLTSELSRIASSTNFNGKALLDGTAGTMKFQVGADGDTASQIDVNMTDANLESVVTALAGKSTKFTVANPTAVNGTYTFTSSVDSATATATVNVGSAGDYKTVQQLADKLNTQSADPATTTDFADNFVASVNEDNELVVRAKNGGVVTGTTSETTETIDITNQVKDPGQGLDFTDAAASQASVRLIDAQLTAVSTARASLGAIQNRFESAISNISVAVENLSASKSRITDVDMASEMVNYTRAQILSQSGTAMLAQANSGPQLALQLLRG